MQQAFQDSTTLSFQKYIEQQFDLAAEQFCHQFIQYPDIIQHVADLYAHQAWQNLPDASHISVSGLDDGAEQFYARAQYAKQYLTIDVGTTEIEVLWQDRFGVQHRVHVPISDV